MTAIFPRRGAEPTGGIGVLVPAASLTALGDQLAARVGPRPDFRAELRRRLMAEALERETRSADPVLTGDDAPPEGGTRLLAGRSARQGLVAAGVVVLLGGGAVSAAAAASSSLPGSPLYPVKRLTEDLRGDLTPGSASGDLARSVDRRLDEVERLVGGRRTPEAGRWSAMEAVLRDTDGQLVQATRDVPPDALRSALAPQRARLAALLPTLTDAQRPAVQRLADLIDAIPGWTGPSGLRSTATPTDVPLAPAGLVDGLVAHLDGATAQLDTGADSGLPPAEPVPDTAGEPPSAVSGTTPAAAGARLDGPAQPPSAAGGSTATGRTATGSTGSGPAATGGSSVPRSSARGIVGDPQLPTRVTVRAPSTGPRSGAGAASGTATVPRVGSSTVEDTVDTLPALPGTLGLPGSAG